ncbi:MAG TPA: ATP-dependent DNA helicase [Pseudolysinimonas sp.]|nr:ATP-dependent DNA helicase [Pseudolysinimonas sp.]
MSAIRFERGASAASEPLVLDPGQQAVVDLPDAASAAVLGAPGSGKTTTIVELVADRIDRRGWSPDSLLVLASSRAAATRVRDHLALRVGAPTSGPLARTVTSLAFELVGAAAKAAGVEPPRLVTAAEQDADIAAILDGHLDGHLTGAEGERGSGPAWPEPLDPAVRRLRGFRTELRELMARATEYDVDPARLRDLGRRTGRPAWVAAADFIEEYLGIVASSRTSQLDPAELARFAVTAIRLGGQDLGAEGDRVASLRLVIVDDLQEATESTLALLRALRERGVAVIAFGDPDVATNAFRGGEPDALGRLSAVLGDPLLEQLVLPIVHRQPAALRALTTAVIVEGRLGTAAAGRQRQAQAADANSPAAPSPAAPSPAAPPLARIEATSPAREWAAIARVLREEHLDRDVPWSELAVIVRSSAHAPGIARALALAEVPTRTASGGVALRDETAARGLLTLVELGVGRSELTAELATELLLSPYGALDALGLRRLRLSLRAEELAGGGSRTSDALLVEALSAPGRFATIDSRPARQAERLAETLAELRASEGTIEDLLWLAWDRSRLAKPWHDQALGSGPVAAEADRNLDAVVALFTAAKRFAERRPDAPAFEFLSEVLDAEVPEDVLTPRRTAHAVLVTTPSGAVGLEFRTVVVAALQDGVWPNLRARGSLLEPQNLLRALHSSGEGANRDAAERAIDDRKLVLDDELRMFALAVSRARERVVLAAVANDDEQRSVFFSLLPADTPLIDSATRPPLSLRGFTGRLRRTLADPRSNRAEAAAAAASLAELARLGLPGASPDDWHGLEPISSTGPLFEGSSIPVSPSRMERLEESPLDWFLETMAGGDSGVVAGVGTILHWAMETTDDPVVDTLWSAVESRWGELVFESPWLAQRQKQLARGFTEALAEYLADFRREGKTLVAAEGRFALEYGELEGAEPRDDGSPRPQIVVNGSIDRVERGPDGEVVIVDLKTGRPITSPATIAAHPQLGAYQLAYAEGKFDEALAEHGDHAPGGAKLLYVREGKDGRRYRNGHQAPLDAEGLEAVRERIRQAAVLIAAAEFEGRLELEQYGGSGTIPRLRLHRVRAVSSD